MRDARSWAEEEFGEADLGDARRTRRLVALAAGIAARPAGTVTRALRSSAEREGAFRFLENAAIRSEAVAAATIGATARRCTSLERVVVPVDATSLGITDERDRKGLGLVGTHHCGARGVHVTTALAVAPTGATLGLCAQTFWMRATSQKKRPSSPDGETSFWTKTMRAASDALATHAPGCTPWFQVDRGGDCNLVLLDALKNGALLTVRAQVDRNLDEDIKRLWPYMTSAKLVAKRKLKVSAGQPIRKRKYVRGARVATFHSRVPRTARLHVRAARVTIVLQAHWHERVAVELGAVFVTEHGYDGADALEWMLLTTHPIDTRKDVLAVVEAYTLRWRIEDFHRAWKRGLCRVEDTQLRSRDAIFKWATLLATVATRAIRLAHLARTTPDALAATEFTPLELEAIVVLRQPRNQRADQPPTLLQVIRWVAEIGGHSGPWAGVPGATTIGRGLHDVLVTAKAFEYRDKKR